MKIQDFHIARRNYWLGVISTLTGVSKDDIMSSSRKGNVKDARHLLAWLLYELEHFNTVQTGALLHRNHRTIACSVQYVRNADDINNPSVSRYKTQLIYIYQGMSYHKVRF